VYEAPALAALRDFIVATFAKPPAAEGDADAGAGDAGLLPKACQLAAVIALELPHLRASQDAAAVAAAGKELVQLRDQLAVAAQKRYALDTTDGADLKRVSTALQAAAELVVKVDAVLPAVSDTKPTVPLPPWLEAYRHAVDLMRSALARSVPQFLLEARAQAQ
jgi:hypothetical protein